MYKKILEQYKKLETDLQDPALISNTEKLQTLSQEYSDLKETGEKIKELKQLENNLNQSEEILKGEDEEMKEMAKMEIEELNTKIENLNQETSSHLRRSCLMDVLHVRCFQNHG